jgi:predicted nucleic acid-binding protein
MSAAPVRVVYDCVVFLQGVGRRGNAARKCLELVDDGTVQLCLSPGVLALVTWNDRHLTYLMRQETPEGIEFCQRFPSLRIVDPPTFLDEIRNASHSLP